MDMDSRHTSLSIFMAAEPSLLQFQLLMEGQTKVMRRIILIKQKISYCSTGEMCNAHVIQVSALIFLEGCQ